MARTKTTSQGKKRPATPKKKVSRAGAKGRSEAKAAKAAKPKATARAKPKAKAKAKASKAAPTRASKELPAVAAAAPVPAAAVPVAAEPAKKKAAAAKPKAKRIGLDALVEIGRQTLGIEALRPGQEEALRDILAGRDVLAVMPTGSGKSLLYQLPSLVLPGLTVVVSPLIALITDQVEKMRERGVAVARVDSTLTVRQKRAMLELVDAPGGKLLLTTPERMADPEFRKLLAQAAGTVGVSLYVVDEAHCVSQWGHDFRPSYLILGQGIEELGRPQVLATTATAPPHVRDDILHQLGIPRAKIVTTSFERPNLSFEVIASPGEDDKKKVLLALVKKLKRPGIVYCATVKAVEQLGEELARHGVQVATYHGRMNKSERDDMQARFMDRRSKLVMVATNAFGLGVDKADIRYVIHYHVPGSLEQYAQEGGRGGRDGLPARCVLLFSPDDVAIQEHFLKGTYPTRRQVMAVLDALEAFAGEGRKSTLTELAMSSHVGTQRTRTVIALMKEEGWVVEEKGGHYTLSSPRPDREAVKDRARDYERRRIADRQRLDALLEYVRAPSCRNAIILSYLGEKQAKATHCGRCDNCLRSAAEARAVAQNAAELEEVLARQTAEAEGELGDDFVAKPGVRRARTRLISLDAPPQPPAPPIAAPADESSAEVEPIERTAAELAEDESDTPTEITVLKRKKKAAVHHPPPTPGGAAAAARGREMEGRGKRRRRRHGKDHRPLASVAPPGAFTSPVLVVTKDSHSHSPVSPPPASSAGGGGSAPEARPPTAPATPAHAPHHAPRGTSGRGGGPIVEYVRRPMKIAVAPVASATPHDVGGGRRRKRGGPKGPGGFGARPQQQPPSGAPRPHGQQAHGQQAHGQQANGQPRGPLPPPGGAPMPGMPSPPGQGKRRRRRRKRGGAGLPGVAPGVMGAGAPGPGQQQPGSNGPSAGQPGSAAGGAPGGAADAPPPSPTQRFWMPAGAPLPRPPSPGPNGAGGSHFTPPGQGQPGGQPGQPGLPGSGKRRRRRRRRRGTWNPAAGPQGAAPRTDAGGAPPAPGAPTPTAPPAPQASAPAGAPPAEAASPKPSPSGGGGGDPHQ